MDGNQEFHDLCKRVGEIQFTVGEIKTCVTSLANCVKEIERSISPKRTIRYFGTRFWRVSRHRNFKSRGNVEGKCSAGRADTSALKNAPMGVSIKAAPDKAAKADKRSVHPCFKKSFLTGLRRMDF